VVAAGDSRPQRRFQAARGVTVEERRDLVAERPQEVEGAVVVGQLAGCER
jgi:hypothetical protein